MGVDYYKILKVSRAAMEDDLRKAYKKLAMKWHPDKHPPGEKEAAEAKFKQICEAYDVLIDPLKRKMYDEELRKGKEMEKTLECRLEELYLGSKRKMKISRVVLDDLGKPKTVEEVLSIDIKPGWKSGTKITFPEKGNHEPGHLPGDLTFVIEEKPHSVFKRDGNDLVLHQKITLLEALTGKTLNITTLDGRTLNMNVSDIVKPRQQIVIPNEGMPIAKNPNAKGDLRIKFDVKFPSRLSSEQKSDLKRVLGKKRT